MRYLGRTGPVFHVLLGEGAHRPPTSAMLSLRPSLGDECSSWARADERPSPISAAGRPPFLSGRTPFCHQKGGVAAEPHLCYARNAWAAH